MSQTTLNWKRGWFSNETNIYRDTERVGFLDHETFSMNISGQLLGKSFTFKGGLFSDTHIFDDETNQEVGVIKNNVLGLSSKTKATINGEEVVCQYTNIWQTRWKITVKGQEVARFKGSNTKGTLTADTPDPLLLLMGFYVSNYIWISMVVFTVIFLVVIR